MVIGRRDDLVLGIADRATRRKLDRSQQSFSDQHAPRRATTARPDGARDAHDFLGEGYVHAAVSGGACSVIRDFGNDQLFRPWGEAL